MNVFPRISFMLSSIPLRIPEHWFKEINKQFTLFLWRNKKPRISLEKLSMSRNKGGLGVPDIYLYYLAFNIRYPMLWAYHEHLEVGSWLWLEQNIVKESTKDCISLSSLWYGTKLKTNIKNPIISFSCDMTKIIHKRCNINGIMLPSCPLWKNPLFTAGDKTLSNEGWKKHDIMNLGQIIKQAKIISFTELKPEFDMNHACFFAVLLL